MEAVQQEQYEFNQAQDETFSDVSKKMGFCGTALVICGVLTALGGLGTLMKGGVVNLLMGVIYVAMGIWTNKAAKSFMLIVTGHGSDITNLMDAMVDLKKLYTIQYWMLIAVVIFVAVALVVGIVAIVTVAGAGHH